MHLNELEEAFPGSRFLALSEQRANKLTGEQKEKYYDASQINSFPNENRLAFSAGFSSHPITNRLPCAFDRNASGGSSTGRRVSG
jgi:hypothetical protein